MAEMVQLETLSDIGMMAATNTDWERGEKNVNI